MPAETPKLRIGLTGGIGSGKSEVGRRFEALGVTVIDADQVARQVVEPGQPALQQIEARFGPDVLTAEGELDRRALRDIIFQDKAERQWLEALMHPLINEAIRGQLALAEGDYVILMSPLLLETGQDELVDRVLVVDAPEAEQIRRASRRDQSDLAQIEAIVASQMPRQERRQRAHDIIENHDDLAALDGQIKTLHRHYQQVATNFSHYTPTKQTHQPNH